MVTRGFTGRRVNPETAARLPPGQHVTQDFPVLSASPTPEIDLGKWKFTLKRGSRPIASWSWMEFNELPRTHWTGDIHCVTSWSKFDTAWEGVSVADMLARVHDQCSDCGLGWRQGNGGDHVWGAAAFGAARRSLAPPGSTPVLLEERQVVQWLEIHGTG